MASSLQGAKIAILVADGFEQVELSEPRKALKEAGAQTAVVSPAQGKVKGWNHTQWGEELDVDVPLDERRFRDDVTRIFVIGAGLETAARQPIARLERLVAVRVSAEHHGLSLPRLARKHCAQQLGRAALHDDLPFEVRPRAET